MKLKWVLMVLVVAGAFFGGGWLLRRARPASAPGIPSVSAAAPRPAGSGLFRSVFQTIEHHAVDSLDSQAIYRLATSGVLAELGDPYAALVPGSDSGAVNRLGEPPVEGLYLDQVEGFVEVVAVMASSPAAAAGVRPGDAVLAVDRTTINLQRAEQVARLIDGPAGTTVRLRLGREGASGRLWVTLTRGSMPERSSLVVHSLDQGVVHLTPARIDTGAARAVAAALDSAAPRAAVLDLRGVVEGNLAGAIALAEHLLDRGATVAITKARAGSDSVVLRDATPDPRPAMALVVLVDRSTAGAAEVVAGAVQDNDRGLVIGEASYGRGASQSLFPLGNGFSLRLTTSVWLTPVGRTIQRFPELESPDGSPPDTSHVRPKFRTVGGRTVLGGGGIVPDREVAAGEEPSGAGDAVLALARSLIQRAKDRKALLAVSPS